MSPTKPSGSEQANEFSMLREPLKKLARRIEFRKKPKRPAGRLIDGELETYRRIYGDEPVRSKAFYNIGAGKFHHPLWTNVDKISDWYSEHQRAKEIIDYDLLSLAPLPVKSETAALIYTSHTVEHVTNAAAENLFAETFRALRNGGIFRVTAPNIDLDYRAYQEGDIDFFYWRETYSIEKNWRRAMYNIPLSQASIQQLFLSHFAASASTLHADGARERLSDSEIDGVFSELPYEEAMDYCIGKCDVSVQRKYPGNHINWWNPNKLRSALEMAGFRDVYISGYGQSYTHALRDLRLFDKTHPKISLYMEARK